MSEEKPSGSDAPSADAPKDADKPALNDLLASWDDSTESSEKADTPAPVASEGLGDLEYAVDKAVSSVKGDLDVDDGFVRRYLIGLANENDNFDKAFRERNQHRDAWDQVLESIADDFQKIMTPKKADVKPALDDKGLAAAVHGSREGSAGGGKFDNVDWGNLSDSEFAQKKDEVYRLAEAGQLK